VYWFQHFAVRIVPSNQEAWRALDPVAFFPRDPFGNVFMTIGAGTADGDTAFLCSGTLTAGVNRNRDVLEAPSFLYRFAVSTVSEDQVITALRSKTMSTSPTRPSTSPRVAW
jgi:hypothetical protein